MISTVALIIGMKSIKCSNSNVNSKTISTVDILTPIKRFLSQYATNHHLLQALFYNHFDLDSKQKFIFSNNGV